MAGEFENEGTADTESAPADVGTVRLTIGRHKVRVNWDTLLSPREWFREKTGVMHSDNEQG